MRVQAIVFHDVPTFLNHQNLQIAILANLGHFWAPLGQIWGRPAPPNWFKNFDLDLPKPVPASFHAVPTVWDHRNLQNAILGNLGQFGPFLGAPGPNLGAPSSSKLVQNLRLGPPTARSTFVPRCSNRLGPPEPSDRHFGQFGPIWDVFGGPWAKIGGTLLLKIGSKSST